MSELELALRDPEVVEASYEVDRTLLRWSLELSPLERLRACTRESPTRWTACVVERSAADLEGLLRALGEREVAFVVVGEVRAFHRAP